MSAEILPFVWFIAIAVLWTGFFILEGFDLGVGVALPLLGQKDEDRRIMINTVGPVWDGNEVWLITAVGAMFAAFPEWYATIFSAFYLPLFVILVGLILRGVSFEYRHQRSHESWRRAFDRCIIFAGVAVPLLFGLGFANFVRGLPITSVSAGGANPDAVGGWIMPTTLENYASLLTPFALIGGFTFLVVFLFHALLYIGLKTRGDIRYRSRDLAAKVGVGAIVLMAAFTGWTALAYGKGVISWVLAAIAVGGLVLAWRMNAVDREGWAFFGTALSIATMMVGIFVALYPYVIRALDPVHSLSIADAAATTLTLQIMSVAAVIFLPVVIAYQAWTYWVFRKRLSTKNLPAVSQAH